MLTREIGPDWRAKSLIRNDFSLMPRRREAKVYQWRQSMDSPQSTKDSPQYAGQTAADSPHLPVDSPQSGEPPPHLTAESPHFRHELLTVAEPARLRAALPPAEERRGLAALCNLQRASAEEPGALMSRDLEILQKRFFTPIVRDGELDRRHPGVHNLPDQAYRLRRQPE